MSIVFSHASLSDLTLERGRIYPVSQPIQINQDRYLTESNNPKVIDYGDDLNFIQLNFQYLSKDNYDGATNGLKTWFQDSNINYSENSFTLTDEDGVAHTVRFWQANFNMPQTSNGRYQISLTLLKE